MYSSVYLRAQRRMSTPLLALLLWSTLFLLAVTPIGAVGVVKGSQHIGAQTRFVSGPRLTQDVFAAAPNKASCAARSRVCYSPQEIRDAYSLTPLLKKGYTGKGETIIIIDSFGSPTGLQDLQQFDKDYGLPDPPSYQQLAPFGSVPFDPTNVDQLGWADETSLDIQWSHALAPAASIIVLTSPVSETQGVQGMPEFLQLEKYAVENHLGNIISQSWGTTENTLFTPEGKKVLADFENFYRWATLERNVTFFASTGDAGTANPDVNEKIYPFPTVGYPASSPWVTAVGGTSLFTDDKGQYASETVWNNADKGIAGSATGGGLSQYFQEPEYQKDFLTKENNKLLNGARGIPDISFNADPSTAVPVYLGFLPNRTPGYSLFGGTSESAPAWAGLIAVANQYAHHHLGFINPRLYRLGHNRGEAAEVYHDVTVGDNSQPASGSTPAIPGYKAEKGWDAATGWGSPVAKNLFEEIRHWYL